MRGAKQLSLCGIAGEADNIPIAGSNHREVISRSDEAQTRMPRYPSFAEPLAKGKLVPQRLSRD
eukprot:2301452-Pleurochrysis_carterae.AAC.2